MVSTKIETLCCDGELTDQAMPPSVASRLKSVGGINGLSGRIPSGARLRKEAERHQSLADQTRLKILWATSIMDLCPCVLKVITGMSDSKLSYHLKILESERLVKARRTKNWRVYSITTGGKEELARHRARDD